MRGALPVFIRIIVIFFRIIYIFNTGTHVDNLDGTNPPLTLKFKFHTNNQIKLNSGALQIL